LTELQTIQEEIEARFAISELNRQRPELLFLTAAPEEARNLLRELKERHGFTHLVFLTAVDYIEEGRFQLTYLLHNYSLAADIGLRVYLPREGTEMESIHDLWAQAATYQRELKEMFGIDFPGSPRVDEEFILENWQTTPPMRREFDTKKYSEETYFPRPGRDGKEPEEHMKKKLYPEEL
jgi:NADH-quinone oxidoreductase subunit C